MKHDMKHDKYQRLANQEYYYETHAYQYMLPILGILRVQQQNNNVPLRPQYSNSLAVEENRGPFH